MHRIRELQFALRFQVMNAGEETAEELRPTREERHMRSEMAKNNTEPETVTVAMN